MRRVGEINKWAKNIELEIIHFNDVYNLEERPNDVVKAGAARFISALDKYDSKNKLVLFSGDLFSPSNCKWVNDILTFKVTTFYDGEQMVKPFERMNVDISCLGNHELDMGID